MLGGLPGGPELEGRPGGQGRGERARGYPFLGPLSSLPGLPSGFGLLGNPSSYPKAIQRPSQGGPSARRDRKRFIYIE